MKKLFIALLLSGISFISFSQTDGNYKEKSVYLYSFENLTSQEQIDKLIEDVKMIEGITEAKVNPKWESGKGELIFKVEEEITGHEGVSNIDISPVKRAISDNGLVPVDCKKRLSK